MILLRHGESEFNVVFGRTREDPGIRDPQLTPEGRAQAAAAAEQLAAGRNVRRILTSPYTRALQTAEIIAARLGVPVTVDPLVRERRVFICDIGTERSRLAATWPTIDFAHIEERWWPEEEETEAEIVARGTAFRTRMAVSGDWGGLAVVTHWGFIRALTGQTVGNAELVPFDPSR